MSVTIFLLTTLAWPAVDTCTMPIPRKKSCCHCRVARTRCSLTVPCDRCSDRSLHCDYGNAGSRGRPYRAPAIAPAVRNVRGELVALPCIDESNQCVGRQSAASGSLPDDGARSISSPPSSTPFGLSNALVDVTDTTFDFFSNILDQPLHPTGPSMLVHALQDGLQDKSFTDQDDRFIPNAHSSLSTRVEGSAQIRLLSVRKPTTPETFLTAKVLLGQIRQYPRMMMDSKRLPSFMHPRCVIDRSWMTCSETKHTCLPETLAICANLLHMFHNRTPASSRFAWETIHNHQKRLHSEVRTHHCCEYSTWLTRSAAEVPLL